MCTATPNITPTLWHSLSGITAQASAYAEHPDGKQLVRLDDHWFFLEDCTEVRQ